VERLVWESCCCAQLGHRGSGGVAVSRHACRLRYRSTGKTCSRFRKRILSVEPAQTRSEPDTRWRPADGLLSEGRRSVASIREIREIEVELIRLIRIEGINAEAFPQTGSLSGERGREDRAACCLIVERDRRGKHADGEFCRDLEIRMRRSGSLGKDSGLVAGPKVRWNLAITVDARPAEISPWPVQNGCRRLGWYSYDRLDNGGVRSAEWIVPELQQVQVGEIFPMAPASQDTFVVRMVEPERALAPQVHPADPVGQRSPPAAATLTPSRHRTADASAPLGEHPRPSSSGLAPSAARALRSCLVSASAHSGQRAKTSLARFDSRRHRRGSSKNTWGVPLA
jgi:hypothetical protein